MKKEWILTMTEENIRPAAQATVESILNDLKQNDLGIALLKRGESKKINLLDILLKKVAIGNAQMLTDQDGKQVAVKIWPLAYAHQLRSVSGLTKNRRKAIQQLFEKWTALGYNKEHIEVPFSSNSFSKLLHDELSFTKADYAVIRVD